MLSNWKVCSKTPSLRRTAQWAPKKLNSRFMALSIKGASKDARIHMEVFSSSIKACFWKNICLDSLDSLTGTVTVNHLNEQYQVLSGKKTILLGYVLGGQTHSLPFCTKNLFWTCFQTSRIELKIWCAMDCIWWTLRCFKMWSNTVLCVWYMCIFSIETKTKEKTNKS